MTRAPVLRNPPGNGGNMKQRKVFLVGFLFLLVSGLVLAEQLATLPEVLKVNNIFVDDDQFYITENTTIYIYSLKDFKLKKKFGKAGEGPQEFMAFAYISVQPDHLLINSVGKVSYYKKDGTFIKELKSPGGMGSNLFYPLDDGFVGATNTMEDQRLYVTLNYFDANLNKGKELYRMKSPIQRTGKIEILKQTFFYNTYDNKIVLAGKPGFIIDVLDHTGKLLFSIQQKYEPRQFTADDEKAVREVLKAQYREQYEAAKERIVFPTHYPEIQYFLIRENKIYVSTWKRKGDKVEFFIFDWQGKLLKQLFVPFAFSNPIQPYPLDIRKGKVYQAIENEDEEWELHVNEIK
jgi:hypothetical protein